MRNSARFKCSVMCFFCKKLYITPKSETSLAAWNTPKKPHTHHMHFADATETTS